MFSPQQVHLHCLYILIQMSPFTLFAYVYMFMHVYTRVCSSVCVWRPDVNTGVFLSRSLPYLIFLCMCMSACLYVCACVRTHTCTGTQCHSKCVEVRGQLRVWSSLPPCGIWMEVRSAGLHVSTLIGGAHQFSETGWPGGPRQGPSSCLCLRELQAQATISGFLTCVLGI